MFALALTGAFLVTSSVPTFGSNPTAPLDKAFITTQKSVLANVTVSVDGVDNVSRYSSITRVATQSQYSIAKDAVQIQNGTTSYESIKGSPFSRVELSKVIAKYPKAKFISASVGHAQLGYDAPTYMAGYIVEMAKSASTLSIKRKGSTTIYRFSAPSIPEAAVPTEYIGFSESPVIGNIAVDSSGRITSAYASTTDASTRVSVTYSYGKVSITIPKASETISQEIFFSLVQSVNK